MTEILTYMFAAAGTLMLAVQAYQIYQTQSSKRVSQHRSTAPGVADLLNYAAVVDDGVVACKTGALLAGWLYRGEDNSSATEAERELVSFRLNQALRPLGSGWMLHVDAVRRPAPHYPAARDQHFGDPLCAAMDEERRRLFSGLGEMYEGYFVVTVTWLPPVLAQRRIIELMFDDDTPVAGAKARTLDLIATFQREVLALESRLGAAVKLSRLKSIAASNEDGTTSTYDELLRWLQFCVTGLNHPVQLPNNPMYADLLIGGQEMWTGVVPKIGRNYIQTVAIEGFPEASTPGILTAIGEQDCEYRWSSRFIFLDPHQALSQLEKFRKRWQQKVRGFLAQVFNTGSGQIDQDAADMVADALGGKAEANSGLVTHGYYTGVVVLMDESRTQVEASARKLEKAINKLGFTARVETINTVEAWLGSLPGHGFENVRRPFVNTLNLADLLPTSTIWTGAATAPCPFYRAGSAALMYAVTHGSTPFRLNLHIGDVGHTFMFGPTGAGKSTHLAILAAQFRRYAGMQVFSFDKGRSMYPLCAGINATTRGSTGLHFTVAGDDSLAFCPLQFLDTRGDRAWAMEWIATILELNGLEVTPNRRNAIGTAIMSMHESGSRTLSEFCITVQDETMRQALKQYTVDGMMGHLLDAEQDGLQLSDFTVFEIEELMNLGQQYSLPVLLYLFRRVEKALTGRPTVLFLDEAWIALGNPTFRGKIKEWLKVLRKANCAVVLATQSLADAAESGILDVIIESTPTKIYLPNPGAAQDENAALYAQMGLNSRQREILARAEKKRQYYVVSEAGKRLYDLALGPLQLAFVGSSGKDDLARIDDLKGKYGHDWVGYWLADRNLKLSDF